MTNSHTYGDNTNAALAVARRLGNPAPQVPPVSTVWRRFDELVTELSALATAVDAVERAYAEVAADPWPSATFDLGAATCGATIGERLVNITGAITSLTERLADLAARSQVAR
jgi:hypothetical protein